MDNTWQGWLDYSATNTGNTGNTNTGKTNESKGDEGKIILLE